MWKGHTHSEAAGLGVVHGPSTHFPGQGFCHNALVCQNGGMDYGGQLTVSATAGQTDDILILTPSSSQPVYLSYSQSVDRKST